MATEICGFGPIVAKGGAAAAWTDLALTLHLFSISSFTCRVTFRSSFECVRLCSFLYIEKMSDLNPVCFFCPNRKGYIKLFEETSLNEIKYLSKCRKKHKLAHSTVLIPKHVTSFDGYHHECYQKFSAVQKKYQTEKRTTSTSQTTAEEM